MHSLFLPSRCGVVEYLTNGVGCFIYSIIWERFDVLSFVSFTDVVDPLQFACIVSFYYVRNKLYLFHSFAFDNQIYFSSNVCVSI